jgi:tripartite-type tricarboxylate transporter receptor subunit TctC
MPSSPSKWLCKYQIIELFTHVSIRYCRAIEEAHQAEAQMLGIRTAHRRRSRIMASAVALAVTMILMPTLSHAGSWPERIVRITTASAPGSSLDVVARLFAERLAERWRQPVIIDGRPGADGILAVQAFLHANDGHSLLFTFPGTVTVVPLLHESLPYDPVGDLAPISSAAYDFGTVAVTAALPVSSLAELVAFAKARPGSLNWAAVPGAPYLTFLEFQRRAGFAMTYVSYRTAVLALPDLMAGQIQLTVVPLGAALPLAREGRIKLLAVSAAERVMAAPDLPTAIEAGFPELTVEAPLGLFGPKTMPMELRERIAADVRLLASDPTIKQRLSDLGMVARGSTPTEYAAMLAEQSAKWAAFARMYGMHPQP